MLNKIKKLAKPSTYKKAADYTHKYGSDLWKFFAKNRRFPDYVTYNKWYDQVKPSAEEIELQRNHKFDYEPLISIVVPAYNTPINFLEQMIKSVQAQTYTKWQLCIANASPDNTELSDKLCEYENTDKRINIVTLDKNLGIAGNTNKALEVATGDYIAFMDHDDLLPQHALYEVVAANQDEQHDILYSDEDFVTEDLKYKHSPQFKPDWSPHLLECHNYITHFFVVKKLLLDKVGNLNSEYDGAQDYDLVLRCTDASKDIFHISKVLYHWRAHKDSVAGDTESKMYAYDAGKAALEAHFKRRGIDAKVEHGNLLGYYHPIYPTPGNPLVSIIIPNKDHIEDLSKCVNSIFKKSTYRNFEIVIAENNSEDAATFKYYDKLTTEHNNVNIVHYKGEFNYSAINNFAVKFAKGEYLLFLNNDTELITPDAIAQMLGCCMLPEVGAVGAKLLYEDDTVQHAGVVIGLGGFAGHVFSGIGKEESGYANKAQLSYDCGAVTGACLMTSLKNFTKVNGFFENLAIGLSDIDYCLKLSKFYLYTVSDNYALWRHNESKTRGSDEHGNNKKRLNREVKIFSSAWAAQIEKGDGFYNSNFLCSYTPYQLCLTKPITACIDSCESKKKDSSLDIIISGWALSSYDRQLHYYVIDSSNKKLHISLKRVSRSDLYLNHFCSKLDNLCGFEITVKNVCLDNEHFLAVSDGLNTFKKRLKTNVDVGFVDKNYNDWFFTHKVSEIKLAEQSSFQFSLSPKFSILVPLYKTPLNLLNELIESVVSQSYQNWQLCLSDGSGKNSPLSNYLEDVAGKDNRINYVQSDEPLHISDNTNLALTMADGDYIVFGDHDDLFEPDALYELAVAINDNRDVELLYTDEDKIDVSSTYYFQPNFKPDFDIDFLRSGNYFCHIVAVKNSLIKTVGLLNSEFDGAQDFDYVLRCVEQTKQIVHVPKVLYHWRMCPGSTAGNAAEKDYAYIAGVNAVNNHLSRLQLKAFAKITKNPGIYHTYYKYDSSVSVNFVILNCDNTDTVKTLQTAILKSSIVNYRIDVVIEEKQDFSKFDFVLNDKHIELNQEKKCNFCKFWNKIVKRSDCDLIFYVDTNICSINSNTIDELVGLTNREDVGIVGTKIVDTDLRIVDAGILFDKNFYPIYMFMSQQIDNPCYAGRAIVKQHVSCVDPRFFCLKKSTLQNFDYFDEKLDFYEAAIDFCVQMKFSGFPCVMAGDNYVSIDSIFPVHETMSYFSSDLIERLKEKYGIQLPFFDTSYNTNFCENIIGFKI